MQQPLHVEAVRVFAAAVLDVSKLPKMLSSRSVAAHSLFTCTSPCNVTRGQRVASSETRLPPERVAAAKSIASVTGCVTPLAGEKSRRSHRLVSFSTVLQPGHTSAHRMRTSAGSSTKMRSASTCGSDANVATSGASAAAMMRLRCAGYDARGRRLGAMSALLKTA
jgi:hypothetical protein